jgi:hypothetical protein
MEADLDPDDPCFLSNSSVPHHCHAAIHCNVGGEPSRPSHLSTSRDE